MLGKKLPLRSFGIRSCTSPAVVVNTRGRVPLRSVLRSCVALVPAGADHLRGFDLDQLVQRQLDRVLDQVHPLPSAERLQQLGQGRLRQGHRR
ncbi:hypothetical protein ASG96_03925 [Terrabacter sp. Soil810]|nr:hypothetical protein ASG96_03925 [Terrabacter sp. Soil810]